MNNFDYCELWYHFRSWAVWWMLLCRYYISMDTFWYRRLFNFSIVNFPKYRWHFKRESWWRCLRKMSFWDTFAISDLGFSCYCFDRGLYACDCKEPVVGLRRRAVRGGGAHIFSLITNFNIDPTLTQLLKYARLELHFVTDNLDQWFPTFFSSSPTA